MVDIEKYSLTALKGFVSKSIDDLLVNSISDRGLSEEELEKKNVRRNKLNESQKKCGTGDIAAKNFIKSFILDIMVKTYGINQNNINLIIPFNDTRKLTTIEKFDILLLLYKKKYQYDALEKLLILNGMDLLKTENDEFSYYVTKEEIESLYEDKVTGTTLSFEDKLEIVCQRVYQEYKGLGVVDEILDMNVEGVSAGVSGIPTHMLTQKMDTNYEVLRKLPKSYDSVWIMLDARSIHLRFLSFGNQFELERVCQQIYTHNRPGQLSQTRGFIKTTMADGSRLTVFRPPFAESWMFFVRKDNLKNDLLFLETLLPGEHLEALRMTLIFCVKSGRNLVITGQQGSGKTAILIALIKYIYGTYNLRIWEEYFEMYLRRLYPYKNIASLQQTPDISGEIGIDVLKKTDGTVTIVGEASDDSIMSYIISVNQTASRFSMFTHHANTFDKLIRSARNSTLNTGLFRDERIAEEQIISIMDFNLHLEMPVESNQRYPGRLTECIPSEDGKSYKASNIFEYNEDGELIDKNPISDVRLKEMFKNLSKSDRKEFKDFIARTFNKEV